MPLPRDLLMMMNLPKSVWDETTPRTLFAACVQKCREDPRIMCRATFGAHLALRDPIPPEISEALLEDVDFWDVKRYVELLNLCCERRAGIIRRFIVAFPSVPEETILRVITSQDLQDLSLDRCEHVTPDVFRAVNEFGKNLISLNFGSSASRAIPTGQVSSESISSRTAPMMLRTRKLRKLILHGYPAESSTQYHALFYQLSELSHVDLSGCRNLGSLRLLTNLKNLVTLILHATCSSSRDRHLTSNGRPKYFTTLCALKSLRFLDISDSFEVEYTNPDEALTELVESLPYLESLDITHTNLAGTGRSRSDRVRCGGVTDIVGLRSRADRPFKFLGLYGTLHDACRRHHLPAEMISGDANEEQILTAGEAYLERPEMMKYVLNDIFNMFRVDTVADVKRSLDVILRAMHKYVGIESIQISGSASLYHIVKNGQKGLYPRSVTQRILRTLVDGMDAHRNNSNMMRNGCLTLWNFDIPRDVLFDYERIVRILLYVIAEENRKDHARNAFVHRMCVFLINAFACQVEGYHKKLLGQLGAIEIMLDLIKIRLAENVCDDVMEMAWSSMWNVTDETPENCRKFLDCGGMDAFLECCKVFEGKEELLRNMMGLLGNVAEVRELRCQLMNQTFISLFDELLESPSDGIEVSYNAAGVLAHIASDGDEAWTLEIPNRRSVLDRLVRAVDGWDLEKHRNINYRSFEPILRLVRIQHTEEVRYWAVWALANLTTVYPKKYCGLVKDEGGLEVLNEVLTRPTQLPAVKAWARTVIANCARTPYPALTDDEDY